MSYLDATFLKQTHWHIYLKQCQKNTSYKCRIWLESISKTIKHAYNSGEMKIGNYYVDGFENGTVFEFNGCFYHGSPKCYRPETFNTVMQKTMGTIYKRHLERIEYIKQFYKVIEIWECEFDSLNLSNSNYSTPLNPRDALFGGRTNALKLYHKCMPGEKIYYNDFTSLYPYVQKVGKYPVGHPIRIVDNFESVENYFGIIKCKVLAPRGLYLPVLPVKKVKLVFSLCNICSSTKKELCNHSDNERCITRTWCTPEILCAIQEGYKIVCIYEVWHFPNYEQYDKATKTGGLFTEYINLFLKGKQEASGFPLDVLDKEKYRQEYLDKEGILLDLNKIEKNPGKRFVYKLALNSMWGRLGINTDRSQYKIINKTNDWLDMITDDQYIISSVDMHNENAIQVYYKNLHNSGSVQTSVIHAALVTCYARLELYKELKKLGRNVLYFDTDSVVFVHKEGEYKPN